MTIKDIIHIVLFNRVVIFKLTFVSVILLFIFLFLIYPKTYKATVSILPPEKSSQLGGIGSLLSGGADLSNLITGGLSNASSQLFIEIIKSRAAGLYVVRKHNLVKYLDTDDELEAVEKLSKNVSFDLTKEGIVRVSVELNTSPLPLILSDKEEITTLSSKLSNSYVEALDSINREKLSSRARSARIYIEQQLVDTRARMDSVETALMLFQKKNKAVSLPEQLKAAIETAAELKSEIIKTEVELGLIRNNIREDNRTFIALNRKLESLKAEYDKMNMGQEDYLLAFKDVPELGRELAVLLREVKIQNEVYLLLQQQYYKEKIQENRDIPTVQVLDEAIPPNRHSSPKVVYSTFFGGIFIFMFISFLFVLKDKKFYSQKKEVKDIA